MIWIGRGWLQVALVRFVVVSLILVGDVAAADPFQYSLLKACQSPKEHMRPNKCPSAGNCGNATILLGEFFEGEGFPSWNVTRNAGKHGHNFGLTGNSRDFALVDRTFDQFPELIDKLLNSKNPKIQAFVRGLLDNGFFRNPTPEQLQAYLNELHGSPLSPKETTFDFLTNEPNNPRISDPDFYKRNPRAPKVQLDERWIGGKPDFKGCSSQVPRLPSPNSNWGGLARTIKIGKSAGIAGAVDSAAESIYQGDSLYEAGKRIVVGGGQCLVVGVGLALIGPEALLVGGVV